MAKLAFILRMPSEVLGEIFCHSSELHPEAPLVLASVSRTFHLVVHSTPLVWNHLRLAVSESTDESCVRKCELWFSMAGACAMEVDVDLSRMPDTTQTLDQLKSDKMVSFLRVPHILRKFSHRISALTFHSVAFDLANIFISLVYPSGSDPDEARALKKLNLLSSQKSFSGVHRGGCATSFHLPILPHLTELKCVNHPLPNICQTNLQNLRTLSIHYPIRFPPIPFHTVFSLLRSTTNLERLKIEARMTDSDRTLSQHPSGSEGHDSQDTYLITLPSLTHLSLRINKISKFIVRLLLPDLHTLRMEDLDGKRVGSAEETGSVLRQLLVRMELPCETRRGRGLEVLELCGVDIRQKLAGHGDGVWEWCFRRLRTLRELSIRKVEIEQLLSMLTPERRKGNHGAVEEGDEIICPALERLSITSPTSRSTGPVIKFKMGRPGVVVDMDIIADPLSAQGLDYLGLYTDLDGKALFSPSSASYSPRYEL
ncbi:hypothetical protein B0H34DRAFT_723483 [Crassisporium funariophilum]|nr:hypothetical protein B0H34DRAFT_723483 [Crassisporium funariophilum]